MKASLGMSREYLVKGMEDEDVNSYYNYMVRSNLKIWLKKKKIISEHSKLFLLEKNIILHSVYGLDPPPLADAVLPYRQK